jgi:hypothetical protein
LKTQGIVGTEFENGAVAFFDLEAGLKLALYPRKSLATDSSLPLSQHSATEFSLGHNVSSRTEVDTVMEHAKLAGAVIVKEHQPGPLQFDEYRRVRGPGADLGATGRWRSRDRYWNAGVLAHAGCIAASHANGGRAAKFPIATPSVPVSPPVGDHKRWVLAAL